MRQLADIRDFPEEIQLAHCVRGGMVRSAGWEGEKKGGGRKSFIPMASSG